MSDAQGTAYLIAHIRAEEAALPEAQRLFGHPYAALFQPGPLEREGVERFLAFEFIREHVRLRTRRIDDVVRSAIRGGIMQVVLRGAGAAGFRTSDRTLFVWEGVAPYLTDAAVDRSLAFMARAGGAGTQVVLDYHVLRVAKDDLARRLREAGFARVEDVGMDALCREHLGGEPPGVAASFRVAWAET